MNSFLQLIGIRFEPTGPEVGTILEMSRLFNEIYGSGEGKRLDIIPWLKFGLSKETLRLEKALSIRDELWKSLNEQHGTVMYIICRRVYLILEFATFFLIAVSFYISF
jgi:hypothetical protein